MKTYKELDEMHDREFKYLYIFEYCEKCGKRFNKSEWRHGTGTGYIHTPYCPQQ